MLRKVLTVAVVFAIFALPTAANAQEAEPPPRVQGSLYPSLGHLQPYAGWRVMRVEIMTRGDE